MRSSDVAERHIGQRDLDGRGAREGACSPLVFVFFDVWTLITGRQTGMIEHILNHGFSLLDFEFKTLSEADAEEIYRTNHPIRECNSWHVARLVYPMGRSLGLLFGFSDQNSCACSRMQHLKGKANPSLNRAGQLRYDFLAPNRCLSLMHSSDNLEQVRREGVVFFAADRIDRAYVAARDGTANSSGLLGELAGASSELGIERIDEPGLGTLFARIRLRLIKELQRRYPALSSWQATLSSYRALWESLSRDNSRGPVMTEAKRYLQLVARERPLVDAMVSSIECATRARYTYAEYYRPPAHEPLSILRCLQVLNNPEVYSRWDSSRQLPENMLHDRWERLLFRTHLFNFDDMLSVPGDAP
jgi:nucleoside diphosphate kinase